MDATLASAARPASGSLGWFGYLNWVLLLANLIPALPFDGGRMLRAVLASTSVVAARDNRSRSGRPGPSP